MMTLRQWSNDNAKVPLGVTWSIEELGRAMGMQALFARQSPQKLAVLREGADRRRNRRTESRASRSMQHGWEPWCSARRRSAIATKRR